MLSNRYRAFALLGLLVPGTALADDPKFTYAKPDDEAVDGVEWKAQAQGGLVLSSGNARYMTLTGGLTASRKEGKNKLALELGLAYTKTDVVIAADTDGQPGIGPDEIQAIEQTTANTLFGKARYDRFLTEKDSLYMSASLGRDRPAGKDLYGGGQLGYSRLLIKNKVHEVATEVGYDFTYEDYVANVDSLAIHSARVFAGYVGTLNKETAVTASGELLSNLNTEAAPTGEVGAFGDERFIGKLGVTTALTKDINLRVGFTAKYDSAPAPRAPFAGVAFEPGFVPLAEKLDTLTEAAIIFNLK
jgi:putative salt-induced outer membrane protein YdiY